MNTNNNNNNNNNFLSNVARESVFTDLDFGFRVNPNTGDLSKRKDVESVRQSCLNILLTSRGEKPFDPEFGSNIKKFLFETIDPLTIEAMKEDIRLSIIEYEPRVKVKTIDVRDLSEKNLLDFRVEVEIKSPEATLTEIAFTVERQR